ncbi:MULTISPECIES: bacteriocin-like protein [unclassified Chryseobacterium]|uniref:bacteriocin-like protein n=1 Tax=unclassified Chryseobacterium TaxID=2593645 RepID=UPI0013E98015|nr:MULTISPECIES: hypothetical protein [unclassified Chryseobacterium]
MKNLKKVSREQLKAVQGGGIMDYPKCGPKTQLRCYSIEYCDPEFTDGCPCVCVRI